MLQEKSISEVRIPDNFIYPEMFSKDRFYYEMVEEPILNDLKERLVIDWGSGTRSWHQWLDPNKPKEVIEILPVGYYDQFPGFLEFILDGDDLLKTIQYPDSNKEWHRMLSSVAGVYLIVDSITGKQYVGSAYGKEGILGRWKQYAQTRHGGNEELKRLLESNPDRFKDLKFTILRTLQKELTKNEVIKYESIYKEKLGTRAFGLNLN
ncbi:GIY-YIG nuclease family protein [Parageobacillus thermoglucosidasius]|uniref:GIY-YIG nuclease family protein n=1 Tax=Parageobacillus thermoglucosidasius TaxID=1426 RepID=A0AB38QX30_PARTM|nr:GIY-YIG nuclease family protein [Parageobacillus thermoglucosidasius]UOE74705.1 GIY-YIG nuclease family protein [Parageobacillus thermoglucosidasius]